MIRIDNNLIPLKRFSCLNILGVLFVRLYEGRPRELSLATLRHEAIHTVQQYEILMCSALVALLLSNIYASWWYLLITILLPLAIYVIAWIVELLLPPYKSAYKDSPFEREAYANCDDPEYLVHRTPFAWCKYILRNRK